MELGGKQLSVLNKIVVVFGAIGVIGTVVGLYFSNVYRPKVALVSVDYLKGIAIIKIGSQQRTIYAGSQVSAGAGWSVRFNKLFNVSDQFNRIELSKNDIVYQTLDHL